VLRTYDEFLLVVYFASRSSVVAMDLYPVSTDSLLARIWCPTYVNQRQFASNGYSIS
jgi:hypothetical protein